ncbi:hypothetical protein J3B01_002331 [Coemansia erecta]|nr:hypothetical protein LPJ69_004791 [Coemansia sp. RSA 1752]KAJ1783465.1 hypothetical protein LPJ67_004707 [Coemansia sp. RSA 1938]KAJ2240420.1 hypothetical protein GGH97_004673 [Coemansia sp. RSA 475]KAJ2439074.1 hypothetical protein IWW46_004603 [Coemansia sp. RSA 2440]KAJ2586327.1 hypothetical protein IWW49_004080 [Coemansia sp. RSA 1797]KAJ2837164.1 hypothetical protein J3B01_002331 [Coemansia erecta]
MGLAYAGTSILRTLALGLAWPLSIISLILSCLVAANGHWKPRAASIWTAIVSCLTILTIPLILLGKTLRMSGIGGARCSRMWELILTGLWLSSLVWIATQLNKFSCHNPTTRFSSSVSTPGLIQNAGSVVPVVGNPVGFSLYGHALTPQGAPRDALESMGMHAGKSLSMERVLGRNGRRRYGRRCRCFKALLGFVVPIFTILALDLLAHLWRTGDRDLSRSVSVSSVDSVVSPRVANAEGPVRAPAAVETKV